MLQVSDGGERSDGEEREVNVNDVAATVQADVGAGVVDPEVTEAEGAVGCDGHAAGLVLPHPPSADLLRVQAALVEGPGDEGAVRGNQVGTGQEGVTSKSVIHKHRIFFATHTWKHKSISISKVLTY